MFRMLVRLDTTESSAVLKCGHGYHYRGRGKTGRKVGEDGVGEAGGDHSLALKSVPADGEHRPRQ